MAEPTPVEAQESVTGLDDDDIDELTAALEASKKATEIADEEPPEEDTPPEETLPEETPEETPVEEVVEEPAEDKPPEEVPEEPAYTADDEVRDLRTMLRSSKRDMAAMKGKLERLEKGQSPVVDDEGNVIEPEPTKIEELQQTMVALREMKGPSLDTLVEAMSFTEPYKDITEVCTRENFDDILEAISEQVATEQRRDVNEVLLEAELSVWSIPNPYKYMYKLIKEYHPKYAEPEGDGEKPSEKETGGDPKTPKPKEPPKAPGSIANLGGGSGGAKTSGWSAERIDKMEEDELDKVPAEIYQKYLRGELD
jgi:hypothetical protein